ncbi:hypothetical protein FCM35_KLT11801 [Carex littledalei]|uniref:Uncharacterized protein n=1 Tax=Carex littledalei TaxID=544730 RepID=A0A833QRX2_9POAL|nr:hypothetical protein FCM35_KLT11801 [Carex littledalei]
MELIHMRWHCLNHEECNFVEFGMSGLGKEGKCQWPCRFFRAIGMYDSRGRGSIQSKVPHEFLLDSYLYKAVPGIVLGGGVATFHVHIPATWVVEGLAAHITIFTVPAPTKVEAIS